MTIRDKSVFLSGPMSGIENYNVAAFAEAHARIKELNPIRVYDPAIEYLRGEVTACSHEGWMRICISELVSGCYGVPYEVVVQLPGWDTSAGARLEAAVAHACGIEVISLEEACDGD